MRNVKIVGLCVLVLVFTVEHGAIAHDVNDSDGWCCGDDVRFDLNIDSFLNPEDYCQDLGGGQPAGHQCVGRGFPNQTAVVHQVSMAAAWWNDAAAKMNLIRDSDVTTCAKKGNVCFTDEGIPASDAAYCHWSYWSCLSMCSWDTDVAIDDYWIRFDATEDWALRRSDWPSSPLKFFVTAAHEFGHALGLGHEWNQYEAILMNTPGSGQRMITEDEVTGMHVMYGSNKEPLHFRSVTFGSSGLTAPGQEQTVSDTAHKTYGQPSIAASPWSINQFDYAVAWSRENGRLMCIELIEMVDYDTHQVVEGPWCFSGFGSWQGPSVAVSDDGRVGIAFRYEAIEPDASDPVAIRQNSRVRLIVSNTTRTGWYIVSPSTCSTNGVCRSYSTPSLSYSWGADRWVLAFTEGPEDDTVVGNANSLTVLLSSDETGYYWNLPPLRTGSHSSFVPPGVSCDHPRGADECWLAFASWDHSLGWMARVHQMGIVIDSSQASGLRVKTGSVRNLFRSGFGKLHAAGNYEGWVFTRLSDPGKRLDDMSWSLVPYSSGMNVGVSAGDTYTDMESEKGYAIACSYWYDDCRVVWAEQ